MIAVPHLRKETLKTSPRCSPFGPPSGSDSFAVKSRHPPILPASILCASPAWSCPSLQYDITVPQVPGDSQEVFGLPTVIPEILRISGLHPLSQPQNFLLAPWRSGLPQIKQEDLEMVCTHGAPRGRGLLRPENHYTLDAVAVVRSKGISSKAQCSQAPHSASLCLWNNPW